jgi:NADH-quinone oxidoreductase subunit H
MSAPLASMPAVTTVSQRAEAAFQAQSWFQVAFFLLLAVLGVAAAISVLGLVLSYVERKVAGHFQCRLGPMRVGWHGILQGLADGLKLALKEGIEPHKADVLLFVMAPLFSVLGSVLLLAVLPVAPNLQVIDLNVGVLYVSAVGGLGVIGILLGGWCSQNKWSLLGAMRAGAQIISYEVSLTLALLVVVLFSGSLQLSEIIASQEQGWWLWRGHLPAMIAFIIFVIASTAELNRTPFDLAEGESELTGGFHTEYTGLRFSFFFLAEFANLFVFGALAATFFLGGWLPFHIGDFQAFNRVMDLIPPVVWFAGKTVFFIFLLMWIRWTFPRLRIDQLMKLEWKILLPIGLANLILAACLILSKLYFFPS